MNIYENIRVFGYDDLNQDRKSQIDFLKTNKKDFLSYACWKADIISSL